METKQGKNIFNQVKDNILYAGLDKETLHTVQPLIQEENSRIMHRLSMIGMLFGMVMSGLAAIRVVNQKVLPAYLFLFVSSLFFLIVHILCRKRKHYYPRFMAYVQMSTVLIYGVLNSAVFAPDPAAIGVTVIVLITLVPFLLTDVPWREWILILAAGVFYGWAVYAYKYEGIQSIEMTNDVCFTLVSCMCASAFTTRTIHSMADRLYIEKERDTDSLTGLSSRHAGEVMTRSLLKRNVPGVFVMMDVDHFKDVNDNYGHQYGDHILELVGAAVSSSVRRRDMACRYGGDEFCMYLTECSEPEAQKVMQRIMNYMQVSQRNNPIQVTLSYGFSMVSDPSRDLDNIVHEADHALYNAKRNRKN